MMMESDHSNTMEEMRESQTPSRDDSKQLPSTQRTTTTKLITKTSILVVSVLLCANLMLAEGVSLSPSLAPTASSFATAIHPPSLSPTRKPSSKHSKKHKKGKSGGTRTTPAAAFGLDDKKAHKGHKKHKSRIRPEETKAKPQTAFVRERPVRNHKGRKQQHHPKHHSSNDDSAGSSAANPLETKRTKKSPKRRIPKAEHKVPPEYVTEDSRAAPTIHETKKAKSHKKTKHRPEKPAVEAETKDTAPQEEEICIAKEPKKGPKRTKRKPKIPSMVKEEVVTLDVPKVDEVEVTKEEAEPNADSKRKKKKKKRRKAKLETNIEPEETVEKEEEDKPIEETITEIEEDASVQNSLPETPGDQPNEEEEVADDPEVDPEEDATEVVPEKDATEDAEICKESSPPADSNDVAEQDEVEEDEAQENSSLADEEEVVEESIGEEASVEDVTVGDEEAETVGEDALQADADANAEEEEEVAEESVPEEANVEDDMIENEEEEAESVAEEASQADEDVQVEKNEEEEVADESIEEASADQENDAENEQEEVENVGEEGSQEDVDVQSNAEEGDVEEANVEEEEENIEIAQEESLEVETVEKEPLQEDEKAEIAEKEESIEADAGVVDEESIAEEQGVDEETADTSEIVPEESSKADLDAVDNEATVEEEDEDEDEDEDDEDPDAGDQSTEIENETHRGVPDNGQPNLEISSSEDSDIDPNQDVVSFIEEVLHENVRSWIEESDSHAETVVNKTRGGHTDVQELESESKPVEEKTETTADAEVLETPESDEEENEAANQEAGEEPQEESRIMDRESLETMGDKDSDAVVSVVTWNLAEDSPSEEDAAFIRKFRKNGALPDQGSDLVLISGQECENIKPRRSEGRRSREYRRLMIKMLGRGYVPLALHLLGGIQFGLFAKRSFVDEIVDVSVADVTCGIGNVLHNKGAIAAFLTVRARNQADDEVKRAKTLRMVFVTAHLAAHVKKADARDSDFWRISSELEAQAPEGFLPRKPLNEEYNGSFLFDSVDRVFFCGDLNYRLDLPRELTEHAILHEEEGNSVFDLLRHDQLIHSMAEGKAFPRFGEGKITFLPTFKYDKESSSYDTSHKQRIPAWTDRILFQPAEGIRVLDYQSIPEAQSSDHRPVYGAYRIGMEGRVLPPMPKKRRRRRNVQYD